MSKKIWRLVRGCFLILGLVALLSLAPADFSGVNQADLKPARGSGHSLTSKTAINQEYVSPTPILLRSPQYLTKKTAKTPSCLQSR